MKIGLRYETVYRPEQPVGFPPHEVRLFLRGDRLTRIRRTRNQRNGNAAPRTRLTRQRNRFPLFPERLRRGRDAVPYKPELQSLFPMTARLESLHL